MRYYLLTAFGKDRPGIVKEVSEILYNFNLNIDDSSMIRLNNEFTMMLIVEDSKNIDIEKVKKEVNILEKKSNLNIALKEVEKEDIPNEDNPIYDIVAYGKDKVGIIYNISKLLAKNNINIINLFTNKEKDFYSVLIRIEVDKNFKIQSLDKELERLRNDLDLKILISEVIKEEEM